MIRLTMFNPRTREESPALINPQNITYANEFELILPKRQEYSAVTREYLTLEESSKRMITAISFAAGLQEEPDSIYVTETLKQIERML